MKKVDITREITTQVVFCDSGGLLVYLFRGPAPAPGCLNGAIGNMSLTGFTPMNGVRAVVEDHIGITCSDMWFKVFILEPETCPRCGQVLPEKV